MQLIKQKPDLPAFEIGAIAKRTIHSSGLLGRQENDSKRAARAALSIQRALAVSQF